MSKNGNRIPNSWKVDVIDSTGGKEEVRVNSHWSRDFYNITEEIGKCAVVQMMQKMRKAGAKLEGVSLRFDNVRYIGGNTAP